MEFLFALPLRQRAVSSAQNLVQLLRLNDLGITDIDEQAFVAAYIMRHLKRVCLVLYGMDEVKLQQCSSFVQDILKGKKLRDVNLIVTSRPSSQVLNLDQRYPFTRRVELVGFDIHDIHQYAHSVLSEGDAANFLEQVSSNPQLVSFMQTPINCVNACALYRFGKTTLPRTTTAIVSEMLRLVVKQKEEKVTGQAQTDFPKQWQDVAAHLREATDDLACFAFFRLINQCMVFREKDFQQHGLSQEALALGLLESCCDMQYEGIEQQRFAHLIMQESLAARHVIKTVSTDDDLDWLVSELGPLTGHLNAFYRCLSAELQTESGVDTLILALLCVPTFGVFCGAGSWKGEEMAPRFHCRLRYRHKGSALSALSHCW